MKEKKPQPRTVKDTSSDKSIWHTCTVKLYPRYTKRRWIRLSSMYSILFVFRARRKAVQILSVSSVALSVPANVN